ncbi:hypothetical protein D3C76_983870 [compost metagenome]
MQGDFSLTGSVSLAKPLFIQGTHERLEAIALGQFVILTPYQNRGKGDVAA